jgi:carbon-monoxide dehydrogenase catalytic subunit
MKMEFIQKKTADEAVEHFLPKAADKEISLAWDRYEGQLPECGFCESGLSCRDCLQGPCISHPFRDANKLGVCGKDKDIFAIQSLLRLVLKGAMACLDQLSDFAKGVGSGKADAIVKQVQDLILNGGVELMQDVPETLINVWKEKGVCPEGVARDLFKASQKLEGGISQPEELLLWTIKSALLGWLAKRIQCKLKQAVFGDIQPTEVELNMGVLKEDAPNILLYGYFSPVLKQKIVQAADKKNIQVAGVCSDPLLPPHVIPPVTTYGSQEIPLMSGAVDLVVAGDQFVNPSLTGIAKDWRVSVVSTEKLNPAADLAAFAQSIVDQAQKSYDTRSDISRDIPAVKSDAIMGYSAEGLNVEKIVAALNEGKIKGIVILSGSNNVKFTQDGEFAAMTRLFLENDLLCVSEGEASVVLAKQGFLNPRQEEIKCGEGLVEVLSALGAPPVIDCNVTDFLLAVAGAEDKPVKDYPIYACFAEANRSEEVVMAVSMVAMGVSTYFWPCLPVTGSPGAVEALTEYCDETFGARLNIITEKLSATEKAKLLIREVIPPESMSGKTW